MLVNSRNTKAQILRRDARYVLFIHVRSAANLESRIIKKTYVCVTTYELSEMGTGDAASTRQKQKASFAK